MDYEWAMINATRLFFQDCDFLLCFFHAIKIVTFCYVFFHAANLNKFHTKESILKMCRDYLGETVSAGPMDTHVVKD